MSPIAKGEPVTDIADDPEVKGRPRICSVRGPSCIASSRVCNRLDVKTKEMEAGLKVPPAPPFLQDAGVPSV